MSDAWVAIAGTVVGASLTFGFQLVVSSRAERNDRTLRTRTERLAAFSEFAAMLLDYRRAQITRRNLVLQGAAAESIQVSGADVQRSRADAWTAFYRVKLSCEDAALSEAGYRALTQLRDLKDATTLEDVDHRGEEIRHSIERLIDVARDLLPM